MNPISALILAIPFCVPALVLYGLKRRNPEDKIVRIIFWFVLAATIICLLFVLRVIVGLWGIDPTSGSHAIN